MWPDLYTYLCDVIIQWTKVHSWKMTPFVVVMFKLFKMTGNGHLMHKFMLEIMNYWWILCQSEFYYFLVCLAVTVWHLCLVRRFMVRRGYAQWPYYRCIPITGAIRVQQESVDVGYSYAAKLHLKLSEVLDTIQNPRIRKN